jgi:hypothetical protein
VLVLERAAGVAGGGGAFDVTLCGGEGVDYHPQVDYSTALWHGEGSSIWGLCMIACLLHGVNLPIEQTEPPLVGRMEAVWGH